VRRPLLAIALAAAFTGCGNDITRPPETRVPDPPRGTREVKLDGIRFTAPFNWPDLQPEGQRIGGIQNKLATVAIWRYPRSETLPKTRAALKEVRDLLIERVKQRDTTFDLRSSELTRRGGARAIELVGRQTMAGLPYEVRSSHIFHDGAEIVVDAFSPPQYFERLDETVFVPLLDSLELRR
jgi:hypothetical protein